MEAQQCVKLTGTNRSIGLISIAFSGPFPLPGKTGETIARSGKPRFARYINIKLSKHIIPYEPQSLDPGTGRDGPKAPPLRPGSVTLSAAKHRFAFIDGLVAIARVPTPDPIPNSAVKTLRANGTAS